MLDFVAQQPRKSGNPLTTKVQQLFSRDLASGYPLKYR